MAYRMWWWRGATGTTNFGDDLGPLLVERLTGSSVEFTELEHCDLVGPGSVLDVVHRRLRGNQPTIWGSGFIRDGPVGRVGGLTYLATRGPNSRTRLGFGEFEGPVLGDPGLLADTLLRTRPRPVDRVALIPHYVDAEDREVQAFRGDPRIDVLDVRRDPLTLVGEIARYRAVVSSSLHGLIVAEALGIPHGWAIISDRVQGAGWKFRDHFAAVGVSAPSVRLSAMRADLTTVVTELTDTYLPGRSDRLKVDLQSTVTLFPAPR